MAETLKISVKEEIKVSEKVGATLTKGQNAFIKWLDDNKKELLKFRVKEIRVGVPGIISVVFGKERY